MQQYLGRDKDMEEIERKFLVKELPQLKGLEYSEIEQYYINIYPDPIIRLRKFGDEYYLTYKSKKEAKSLANVCNEFELPINTTIYNKLLDVKIGNLIRKKRYKIILSDDHVAELDIFEGNLSGLIVVEVEFASLQEVNEFNIPQWFGKDVTHEKRLINSRLSQINKLEEIKEILI